MVASPKQVGCISGRNSEIGTAEIRDHCKIYADNLSVSVKKRPARTARCRRGIINDLVFKDVPYMSLCGDGPNKVVRSELRHDDPDVLSTACNLLRNFRLRSRQNAFHPGRVADQDYRPSRYASFTSIVKFQQLRMWWRRVFQFERRQISLG